MKLTDKYKKDNFIKELVNYDLDDLIEFSKTARVLFITSDEEQKKELQSIFSIFFSEIDVALNANMGLELFNKNKYDLIITSIELEDSNCIDVLSKIRQISRHITILALSSQEKYFIELIRLGIDGYILIPIEINQFVEIMKKIINTLLDKERLYNYRINLENMLDEKTKELQDINKNLEAKVKEEIEKNRVKDIHIFEQAKMVQMGEMVSNIAHQWRQPLSAISTISGSMIVENEIGILNKESLSDRLQLIVDKTKYLSDTINVFRNFVGSDKEFVSLSLESEFEQVYVITNSMLEEYHINLVRNCNDLLNFRINMIRGELTQVLVNIINNAKDVLLEREIKDPTITITLTKDEKFLYISIEDNAQGIPKDVLPKIFDPYFTTKHQSQGTGLGLHMSYKIIEKSFSGSISAENTEKGAKFLIKIPIS